MKVKYKIVDIDRYNSCCSMIEDLYPNDPLPNLEDYTKRGSGEVVGFIQGGFWSKDKFIIADDETNEFIKVNVEDCERIKEQ